VNTRLTPDEMIVVLDFGGQYAHLIARRIRECHVYSEILPYDTPLAEILRRQPKGIVLSGGPASVYEEGAPVCDPGIFELGIPILGICYGMQLMAKLLGGKVAPADRREFGKTRLEILDSSDLFDGLNLEQICWMSHGDQVTEVPSGFRVTAQTANGPAAMSGAIIKGLGKVAR